MVSVGEWCVEYLLKRVLTLIQAGVSCKWVNDSQRFLLEFFDTIQNSPSQTYHTALPCSPSSSWLHRSYSTELSGKVKVVKGLPAGWGLCSRTVTFDGYPLALACWKDTIAVGLRSGDIITLDGNTGSQVAVFSGHTDWVRSVTFSSDGTLLVSGSDDETLKLWDIQTGGVIKTFHGHTHYVFSVSISFNHTTIASGAHDNTICLWDIQAGECCHIINQEESVVYVSFSPTNSQHLISISGGVVHQWDIDGHQIEPTYQGSHAAFSLDGTHLALCEGKVTTVQNFNSGAIVARFPTDEVADLAASLPMADLLLLLLVPLPMFGTSLAQTLTSLKPSLDIQMTITSLTFSSSSSLISASNDKSVKFWQIGTSSIDLVASDPESTQPASASVESVSLQAENGIAISGDLMEW
jgi:WD40 repeat protein